MLCRTVCHAWPWHLDTDIAQNYLNLWVQVPKLQGQSTGIAVRVGRAASVTDKSYSSLEAEIPDTAEPYNYIQMCTN